MKITKPVWWNGSCENDWTEDSSHENGNYFCECITCGENFVGHKRRHVCKKCKLEDDVRWQSMSEEERQSELADMAKTLENYFG